MSTKILDLRGPTDAERDAKVNEAMADLAGWKPDSPSGGFWINPDFLFGRQKDALPPYATSADAVLPLLEKQLGWDCCHARVDDQYVVKIWHGELTGLMGVSPTLPLAACYALLRANGYEVLT